MAANFSNDAGTGVVTADGVSAPLNGAIGGTTPAAASVTSLTTAGARVRTISVVAATGATQGTAAAIGATADIVVVTVTASTEGVLLPTPVAGREVTVIADTAVGNKVYPKTAGQSIGTATTATTAYALVKNTITTFFATSTTKWRIEKGG